MLLTYFLNDSEMVPVAPIYYYYYYYYYQQYRYYYYYYYFKEQSPFEKLTGSHLVKKSPVFYGTQMFITAFTSAHHLSLS